MVRGTCSFAGPFIVANRNNTMELDTYNITIVSNYSRNEALTLRNAVSKGVR